jgi:hypothetical protein
LEQAQAYNEEAIKIQRDLWNADPSLYGNELAGSLTTKAQLLGIPGPREGQACDLVKDAQRISSSGPISQIIQILADRCQGQADRP